MKAVQIQNGMSTNAPGYGVGADRYLQFTQAEDAKDEVMKFLISKIKSKKVLDVACGNGKYAKTLAKETKSYTGVDISPQQIELAKNACKNQKNVFFFVGDATKLSFADDAFDVVICTWGVSSIPTPEERKQVLKELERVTSNNGVIYIIENSPFDQFHDLRGLFYQMKTLSIAQLILNEGFEFEIKLSTHFKFNTVKEANEVLKYFWPQHIKERLHSRILDHEILVFKKEKNE